MRTWQVLLYAIKLALFFLPWVSCSFVRLTAQGYTNVVIKIDNDVPSIECQVLLKSLKDLFTEASQSLCDATGNRAFFGDVSVIIPNSWIAVSECYEESNLTLSWPRVYKADIILGQHHPLYGEEPFTLQYGGCGDESLHIRISVDFLSQLRKGIKFIHEWFHYRYGVFDEFGVVEDPLYTIGYSILEQGGNSSNLLTSCTNVPTVGQWNQSHWEMNYDDNTNVTSSLMYSTLLPNIKLPCSQDAHMKASPTKQNLICAGKSVSEIMFSHPDFINNKPLGSCGKPTISILGNPVSGYHMILDTSSFMSENIEETKFAISHFVWFLPDGLVFSLDSYGEIYSEVIVPVTLNRTNANKVIDDIQRIQCQPDNSTTGLGLALNRSIEFFHSGMEIVLVTATTQPSSDLSAAIKDFRSNLIAPHILALGPQTMKTFSALAYEGGLYFIPDLKEGSGIRSRRTWITDTLHAIYSRTFSHRAKINEETLVVDQERIEGTFHVDGSSGSLIFAFYELEKSYAFEFIQGSVYSPSGAACPVTQGRSFELFRASCNISEAGNWSYSVRIMPNSATQIRLDTWMERARDTIEIKTWTSSPADSPADISSFVIYALVTLGQLPVSGVELVAHITGNNKTQPLLLQLGEINEHDVTVNDGVYSALVTNYPESSTAFSYVLEIIDSTGIISTGSIESHATAGSTVPLINPTSIGTRFNRYEYGGSFHIAKPHNGSDLWPPGRIKDLKVMALNWQNLTFTLQWTAPKDDYSTSPTTVFKHVITWEEENEQIEKVYFAGDLFPYSDGNQISFAIKLNVTNQTRQVYMRAYGMDSKDNTGDPSNIVTVYVTATENNNPEDGGLTPALFWTLIGIGCATFILIIAITASVVAKRCFKQQKKGTVKGWVEHGGIRQGSKREKYHPQEANVIETSNRKVSNISSWSSETNSALSNYSSDEHVVVHSATIEMPRFMRNHTFDSDDESTVESIVYAQPFQQEISKSNIDGAVPQKKRPPMPPPRRYFGIISAPAARINEESIDHIELSMPYTMPKVNRQILDDRSIHSVTREESDLRKRAFERYIVLLGADNEASLV